MRINPFGSNTFKGYMRIPKEYTVNFSTVSRCSFYDEISTDNNSHAVSNKAKPQPNFGGGKAVYAGSFDPITNGHLDIIKQGAVLFDELTVLVAKNPSKKQGLLSIEERLDLIRKSVESLKNVLVDSYEGLTAIYAKEHDAKFLLRGLRNSVTNFDDEMVLAGSNSLINPDLKPVFLMGNKDVQDISSTLVRTLYSNNGNYRNLVPKPVWEFLSSKVIKS